MEAGDMEARPTRMTIIPHGEPIFCEKATSVEIVDEASGEYLMVTQNCEQLSRGQIAIDPTEWKILRGVIDDMVEQCRS